MSKLKRSLQLSEAETLTLQAARDHHPKAYARERAAALLFVAAGRSPCAVARSGLYKRRQADTVYGWLNAFEQKGVAALYQLARRRRDFPPSGCGGLKRPAAPRATRAATRTLDTGPH